MGDVSDSLPSPSLLETTTRKEKVYREVFLLLKSILLLDPFLATLPGKLYILFRMDEIRGA